MPRQRTYYNRRTYDFPEHSYLIVAIVGLVHATAFSRRGDASGSQGRFRPAGHVGDRYQAIRRACNRNVPVTSRRGGASER